MTIDLTDYRKFEQRKQDHIKLALLDANQATAYNQLEQISLIHEALPDLNFDEIDISSCRFGQIISNPFFVSLMTASHHDAAMINYNLIAACNDSGWAMGVGSQRRELTDKKAKFAWHKLLKQFPKVKLFSNLGIAQIISTPITQVQQLIATLEAEALIIHCNSLQEVIQPEGTPQFKGCLQAISKLVAALPIPIIIKETGCGFALPTLQRLNEIGIKAVDISGLGGTHWGRIEGQRAHIGSIKQITAATFHNWGIDTVSSVKNALSLRPNYEVWGSGGVRHGLDAAKLLALGVNSVGFAKPMLAAALVDAEQVYKTMKTIEYELMVAMFCTGSGNINKLKACICP